MLLRLVVGHHPVVTRTAVRRDPACLRLVASERGERPDLLALGAVFVALRDVRPLAYPLAALGHPLAITRFRTALEALLAVPREPIGLAPVTPERVLALDQPTIRT
jgi:hypothetical protein